MRIVTLRRLRGPNIYCGHPAVVALVDLEELTGRESCDVAGFAQRLLAILPGWPITTARRASQAAW